MNMVEGVHACEIEASKNEECQVAWGYPAFLVHLALLDKRYEPEVDKTTLLDEYLDSQKLERIDLDTILENWIKTLETIAPFSDINKAPLNRCAIIWAGSCIKGLFFKGLHKPTLDDLFLTHPQRLLLVGNNEPLFAILVPAGSTDGEKVEYFSKLVLTNSMDEMDAFKISHHTWGVAGYLALLINYAMQSNRHEDWWWSSFVNINYVQKLYRAMQGDDCLNFLYPTIKPESLKFDFNFKYIDFIKKYLELTVDIVRKWLTQNPCNPIELTEDNNVYSYIYYMEKMDFQIFKTNQLFASFSKSQRAQLESYFKRFLEYLYKTYGANEELIQQIMKRETGSISPFSISVDIKTQITDKDGNDVTWERMNQSGFGVPQKNMETDYPKEAVTSLQKTKKFRYIKSNDPKQIDEIESTMLIYIESNSPAELCRYVCHNLDTQFLPLPASSYQFFCAIEDRWGEQNKIKASGLKMAWQRKIKHRC